MEFGFAVPSVERAPLELSPSAVNQSGDAEAIRHPMPSRAGVSLRLFKSKTGLDRTKKKASGTVVSTSNNSKPTDSERLANMMDEHDMRGGHANKPDVVVKPHGPLRITTTTSTVDFGEEEGACTSPYMLNSMESVTESHQDKPTYGVSESVPDPEAPLTETPPSELPQTDATRDLWRGMDQLGFIDLMRSTYQKALQRFGNVREARRAACDELVSLAQEMATAEDPSFSFDFSEDSKLKFASLSEADWYREYLQCHFILNLVLGWNVKGNKMAIAERAVRQLAVRCSCRECKGVDCTHHLATLCPWEAANMCKWCPDFHHNSLVEGWDLLNGDLLDVNSKIQFARAPLEARDYVVDRVTKSRRVMTKPGISEIKHPERVITKDIRVLLGDQSVMDKIDPKILHMLERDPEWRKAKEAVDRCQGVIKL